MGGVKYIIESVGCKNGRIGTPFEYVLPLVFVPPSVHFQPLSKKIRGPSNSYKFEN